MLTTDDFNYAMEQTRVILPPEKRLETFGNSFVNYYLITENMDHAGLSYVREGTIVAERPQIISSSNIAKLLLEGFGDEAEKFAEQINQQAHKIAVLKYGFSVKKSDTRFYEVHEPFEQVIARVKEDVIGRNDPMATVLAGIDTGWEVSLLKFMVDMITASGEGHIQDLRGRGLL
ncbi:MAG: hypothetical protein SH807_02385 [Blastochloris sp.]|mgnify:CR=1 FL=1|jgi:hypothetical protein|nr:hypothetical protein [Blastochloris sp.]